MFRVEQASESARKEAKSDVIATSSPGVPAASPGPLLLCVSQKAGAGSGPGPFVCLVDPSVATREWRRALATVTREGTLPYACLHFLGFRGRAGEKGASHARLHCTKSQPSVRDHSGKGCSRSFPRGALLTQPGTGANAPWLVVYLKVPLSLSTPIPAQRRPGDPGCPSRKGRRAPRPPRLSAPPTYPQHRELPQHPWVRRGAHQGFRHWLRQVARR